MYGDDPETSLGDVSLEEIDQTAQRDVEMPTVNVATTCIIVDTNILLEKLTMLQRFVEDVKHAQLPVLLIIPGAVLNELDKQKTTGRLGWFSRRASLWMAEQVKERPPYLRCQRDRETCKPSGNWRSRVRGETFGERDNDSLILDCAMHFASVGVRTCLCSADKNLCIESESHDIRTISPSSGHDLARFLFGRDMNEFAGHQPDYTGIDCLEQQDDGMKMEVDDDSKMTLPQASDLLHIQVIDHFTRLLVALVGRIGGPELEDPGSADGGITASRHAPKYKNCHKPSNEWNAVECLEYLEYRDRQSIERTNPRLDLFLSKPYSRPGARTGREWSYEAWKTALDGLRALGEAWRDLSISADVEEVAQHREAVLGRQ
ncbi:PIN domain-containing protein [Mycena amicta]|nr:PIN domain-containing protein [Mycena amicta]